MVVPIWVSAKNIYIVGNFRSLWAYKSNGTGWSLTENTQMSTLKPFWYPDGCLTYKIPNLEQLSQSDHTLLIISNNNFLGKCEKEVLLNRFFFLLWRCDPVWVTASSFLRFLDHTRRCTIVGRTPLDEWSARRRDLYLTTHNTHNRQKSMPLVGFEPMISAGEWPQTYALDCAATGTSLTDY